MLGCVPANFIGGLNMADNTQRYIKKVGDITFSTHEGSGIKHYSEDKRLIDDVFNSRDTSVFGILKEAFAAEKVPAMVKISAPNGDVIKLAGFKLAFDQMPLEVVSMQLPNGTIKSLGENERFTVEFDKETVADPDPKKNQIKGAVTTDSAIDIIEKLTGEGLLKKKLERETPEYMIVPKERKKYPVRTQYASDVTPPTVGSLPRGNKTLLS